jgi:TonB family protein
MKVATTILCCFAVTVGAQAQQVHNQFGSAVDARGVRYVGHAWDSTCAPWKVDALFLPKPDYPYSERSLHHEGVAIFRLDLDLKTGTIANASMIQSSGFSMLDDVAFNTVKRWRLRPGRWKQIEVPIVFSMSPLRPGEPFVRHGPSPQ